MMNAPLSIRISSNERDVLESAAAQARTTLSDFVRRKAIEAAELELMEQRVTIIPAEAWERFEAWARSPPKDIPELRALAESRPPWEE